MARYYITDKAHALRIIDAWENKCGHCDDCILHTPEGWKCGYLYELAKAYIEKRG